MGKEVDLEGFGEGTECDQNTLWKIVQQLMKMRKGDQNPAQLDVFLCSRRLLVWSQLLSPEITIQKLY